LTPDGQWLRTVAKYSKDVVKLPFNPDGQQLNIARLAHASSLASWGVRKRCSKRAGALLKGMQQQLYGSKGEAPGLIIIAAPTTQALCFSRRQDEDGMGLK